MILGVNGARCEGGFWFWFWFWSSVHCFYRSKVVFFFLVVLNEKNCKL